MSSNVSLITWHHFEYKFLPSYSPDFNPIERLWLRLKADYFADFIARTKQELIDRLCFALNALMCLQKSKAWCDPASLPNKSPLLLSAQPDTVKL